MKILKTCKKNKIYRFEFNWLSTLNVITKINIKLIVIGNLKSIKLFEFCIKLMNWIDFKEK
jgi:hypothetical protein